MAVAEEFGQVYRVVRHRDRVKIAVEPTIPHRVLVREMWGEPDISEVDIKRRLHQDPVQHDLAAAMSYPDGTILIYGRSSEFDYPPTGILPKIRQVTMEKLRETYPDIIFEEGLTD